MSEFLKDGVHMYFADTRATLLPKLSFGHLHLCYLHSAKLATVNFSLRVCFCGGCAMIDTFTKIMSSDPI